MTPKQELISLLPHNENYGEKLSVEKHNESDRLVIFGQMYTRPQFTLNQALALQSFFGCEDIRQGEYSSLGCESCDYGSNYGHELHIVKPTLHLDVLGDLVRDGKEV